MYEVHIHAGSMTPFVDLVGVERVRAVEREAELVRRLFGRRAIWNVSSTAVGGGVAEMLRSLLRYARGLRVEVRWAILEGPPAFFRITKRVHNALHGSFGDGSPLGQEQAALFEAVARENVIALDALVRPGDAVICHDPQTAGLVPHLMKAGANVVWRCHIGHDVHEDEVERGWTFLRPYLQDVPAAVFSREAYAPPWLKGKRTMVLPPNIDPFSVKNQMLGEETVRAILAQVGLVAGPAGPGSSAFVLDDGSRGRVDRKAEVLSFGPLPTWETPLVVQVSRWDKMKDPVGVLRGFAEWVGPEVPRGAQLVLAGPAVGSVADDPESESVFTEVERAWRALPDALRRSVHLALLPTQDVEENAAIVNALQRHAAIIVQKSLQEGFGLTVTEALWKRRPVIASAVGGIADQIRDGVDGVLVRDPTNLEELARAIELVLRDEALARRLGDAGYSRVKEDYLAITALMRWAELLRQMPHGAWRASAAP